MHLDMAVGEQSFTSLDLSLFDFENKGYYFRGKRLMLDEPWHPAEEIFSFDVAQFKTFRTEVDSEE